MRFGSGSDNPPADAIAMSMLAAMGSAAEHLAPGSPPQGAPGSRRAPGGEAQAGDPSACGGVPAGGLPQDGSRPLWGLYRHTLLVDVRTGEEFAARHIPDAASLPAESLQQQRNEWPAAGKRLLVAGPSSDAAARAARCFRAARPDLRVLAVDAPIDAWPGPWHTGPARRLLWEPSRLVRDWAGAGRGRRALDLGCGGGRDAVTLAMRGYRVLAVDRLPDALERAQRLATRMGVSIDTQEMDLRRQRPPLEVEGGYDLILMVRYLDRALFSWVRDALRPGGAFLFETFAEDPRCGSERAAGGSERPAGPHERPAGAPQNRRHAGGPKDARWLLRPQEALRAFLPQLGPGPAEAADRDAAMELITYAETTTEDGLPWVRLVIRKRRE